MLVIVNTTTGEKIETVKGRAHWPDGAVTHAPKARLQRGPFRIVEVVEDVTGDGPLIETVSEDYDGENWVVSKIRSYPPLADLKAAKCAEVDAERDRRRWPGSIDTGLGWAVDFRDERDEANITGMSIEAAAQLIAGITDPTLPFRGADDATRTLTPEQMVAVGRAGRQHVAEVYAASWALKEAIAAAEDRGALEAVDVANPAAWPAAA